jgi:hypothetical protein
MTSFKARKALLQVDKSSRSAWKRVPNIPLPDYPSLW